MLHRLIERLPHRQATYGQIDAAKMGYKNANPAQYAGLSM